MESWESWDVLGVPDSTGKPMAALSSFGLAPAADAEALGPWDMETGNAGEIQVEQTWKKTSSGVPKKKIHPTVLGSTNEIWIYWWVLKIDLIHDIVMIMAHGI